MKVIRFQSNPIISPGTEGMRNEDAENICFPSLIRAPRWMPNPLGKYYLYFSHHTGKYIRLAYADDLSGPWAMYSKGTLRLNETPCLGHIASPDVHVDEKNKEIYMYYHGKYISGKGYDQATFLAKSKDGIKFKSEKKALGPFYFRVFKYRDEYYALAKNKNISGLLLKSKDRCSEFEKCFELIPNIRHGAVFVEGDILYIFYSKIKDNPESILLSTIDLKQDHWKLSESRRVLQPEKDYEGALLPLMPSSAGSSLKEVNQVRDPAVFFENRRLFLLYSVAGEKGIAIAEIKGLV